MKVQLIFNPVAGQLDVAQALQKVTAYLEAQGWQVTLRQTRGSGDATAFAREAAASGYDMVVAVGGDGTLGEVANGLAGSDCTMGVLPVGTGNIWARMMRLPLPSLGHQDALMAAAQVLVEGTPHRIDLGRAGDRYFVMWTGIGLDAQVARDVEPHREIRRSLGNLTYVVAAVVQASRMRGTRTTVVVDGRAVRQRTGLVVITNAQLYGPALRLAPQAQLDDGWLEVYIFKGASPLDVIRHFVLIAMGKHAQDPKVDIYRAHQVQVRAERPMPLHLDGDPVGFTPVNITVEPRVLKVVVPTWASGSLFEGGTPDEEVPLTRRIAERLQVERERLRGESERLRDDWERRWRIPPSD